MGLFKETLKIVKKICRKERYTAVFATIMFHASVARVCAALVDPSICRLQTSPTPIFLTFFIMAINDPTQTDNPERGETYCLQQTPKCLPGRIALNTLL